MLIVQQSLKTVGKFFDADRGPAPSTMTTSRATCGERTDELVRSREQYRLIAETTRAMPFELDLAHGRFTYIGPQAQTVLGIPEARWKESRLPRRAAAARTRGRRAPAARRIHARHLRNPVLGGHGRRSRARAALDRGLRTRERHEIPARPDDRRHRGAPPGARTGAGPEARIRGPHRRRRGARDQHLGAVHLRQRALRASRAEGRAHRARRLPRAGRRRAVRTRT